MERASRQAMRTGNPQERWTVARSVINAIVLLCAFADLGWVVCARLQETVSDNFFMSVVVISYACIMISLMAIPILAHLVYERVGMISRLAPTRFFSVMSRYSVCLVLFAVICEPLYDFVRTGLWWDYTAQNPVWALLISVVGVMFWDVVAAYKESALVTMRGLVIAVALVLAFMMQTSVPLVVFTLVYCLWSPDYKAWAKIGRDAVVLISAVLCGVTPIIGLWFVAHRERETKQISTWKKWQLWWAYPLILVLGVVIRYAVIAYLRH